MWYILKFSLILIISLNSIFRASATSIKYSVTPIIYRILDYITYSIYLSSNNHVISKSMIIEFNLLVFAVVIYFIILDCYKFLGIYSDNNIYFLGVDTKLFILFKLLVTYILLNSYYSIILFDLLVDILQLYTYYGGTTVNRLIINKLEYIHI